MSDTTQVRAMNEKIGSSTQLERAGTDNSTANAQAGVSKNARHCCACYKLAIEHDHAETAQARRADTISTALRILECSGEHVGCVDVALVEAAEAHLKSVFSSPLVGFKL